MDFGAYYLMKPSRSVNVRSGGTDCETGDDEHGMCQGNLSSFSVFLPN